MKKIIALVLVFVCLLLAVGCKEENPAIAKVKAAYQNGMPTKIVVDSETNFDGTKVKSQAELTKGSYQGRAATVYTHVYQEFAMVDSILSSPIVSKVKSKEYFEGLSVRENFLTNKRAVFVEGADFAPEVVDSIVPNFDESLLTDISFENGVFKATVPKDNGVAVFGENTNLSSDANIEVLTAGGIVITMTISYEIPAANEESSNGKVTVTVSYYYDVQLLQPLTNE
jgi:hypothetical protein